MASVAYLRGKAIFGSGADWGSTSDRYGVLLATDAYVPEKTHRFVSTVTGELKGGGYERQELAGRKVVEEDDRVGFYADEVTFRGLATNQAYRWAIVFRMGPTDSDSDLIVAVDMVRVELRGQVKHSIQWSGAANGCVYAQR